MKKLIDFLFLERKYKMTTISYIYQNQPLHIINSSLERIQNKEDVVAINFTGNFLNQKNDLTDLFEEILPHFPRIHTLNFSDTSLDDFSFQYVLQYIPSIPNIKNLNFGRNIFFYKSLSKLNLLEPCMEQLEELNFDDIELHYEGVYHLASFFHKMKNLKKLSLKCCQLSHNEFIYIAKFIYHLTNLSHLDISDNSISINSANYLLEKLPKNTLTFLNMEMQQVTSSDTSNSSIAHHLRKCSSLETLYWDVVLDNTILEAICSVPNLKKLVLSNPSQYLDTTHSFSRNLEYIFLTRLSSKNIESVLNAIPNTIQTLRIENTLLSPSTKKLLLKKMTNYKSLKELGIRYGNIDNVTFKKMCLILSGCRDLKDLNFTGNFILDSGFYFFFLNISKWRKLHFISFYNNDISSSIIEKVLPRLNYLKDKPITLFFNNELNIQTIYFEEKINKINQLQEIIQKNLQSKNEMEKILHLKPFIHFVNFFGRGQRTIDQYNETLQKVKNVVVQKQKYCKFIRWVEKQNSIKPAIFQFYDLQHLFYEFL